MTSPRGSNGGGEARWNGLVALPDLGSRVLSAPAALPACYTAALRRLTPSRRFEGAWSKTAGSLKSGPTTHAVAPLACKADRVRGIIRNCPIQVRRPENRGGER